MEDVHSKVRARTSTSRETTGTAVNMTSKERPKSAGMTIVIKLGTSSIISPTYPFLPHLQLLSSIVETVVRLRKLGHRVVLVSSGAIGVGIRRMGLKERGKGLSHKQVSCVSVVVRKELRDVPQALAAIGQGRLIALWDNLFSQVDQPIAQILLTRMDISDRTRYLNAQNTFTELLHMGVVPIVNENDTVAVTEIKFGDNDTLSAISSNIVHADYLFLLTDVQCLYTENPRTNPDAKPVRIVRDIEKIKQFVSTSTLGSSLGTGGMATKLIAAELATAAGVTTVVMDSGKVEDIFGIIEKGPGPCRETAPIEGEEEVGPLCTKFLRREIAIKDRKWWIAHGLHVAGTVVIDEGALRAIRRKESGGRLLPAGVVRIEGAFASHQAVRLVVRRRMNLSQSHDETSPHQTPSTSMAPTPSRRFRDLPSSEDSSQPSTPNILPTASLSSSIASLDPLSRSIPPSPAILPSKAGPSALSHEVILEEDWEEVEVGKGLAQYNSVEMDRIKGMKSSHIENVLGYSESDHVVDSITFV
ncbi:glutamate 5-kinase, partial [Tremellales sp. Uapishka_1]